MKRKLLPILALIAVLGVAGAWSLARTVPGTPMLPELNIIPTPAAPERITAPEPVAPIAHYIEVMDSCGPHFEGACVNVRSGPGTSFPKAAGLRTGAVLEVATTTVVDDRGMEWYRVVFAEWLRYPERVAGDWYIAAPYVRAFTDAGSEELADAVDAKAIYDAAPKRILVDRSDQKLYAYEGSTVFLESPISTGLDLTPTPRGYFAIYRKTPSRYMQGPLPGISDQYYDLPGVPWNLYFTQEGGAIHGAYWHTEFGKQWSHGCVNLPLARAHTLYDWAPLGTPVLVRD